MSDNSTLRICIGIPTFRRPQMLAALLETVASEASSFDTTILVADNDVDDAVRSIVDGFRAKWPATYYLPVPKRGISQARNALIDGAFTHRPDFDWLLMYDDDALLRRGATGRLIEGAVMLKADLAGGPTVGRFPDGYSNIFVQNSVLGRRTRWRTGPIDRLEITQNLAIGRTMFDVIPRPLFRDEFGLSGGEDYDLFRRAQAAGVRQVWCDEAAIDEKVVTDRLSTGSIFYRAYSSGVSIIMVDRYYDSAVKLWKGNVTGLWRTAAAAIFHTVTGRFDQAARDILGTVYYIGRLAWQFGLRAERYR